MSERKVQTWYVSKYFDPSLLKKIKKSENQQHSVRMMLPFSIQCSSCGNFFKAGTKVHMWKETVQNEDYLGIEIYRLYFKCIICYSEMSMKTDPKNHSYKIEYGAIRGYEAFKDEKILAGIQ